MNEMKSLHSGSRNMNNNPLLINTVVRCLFGYVDLLNLKEFRAVNKTWNAVAELLLRKRCKIKFGQVDRHGGGRKPRTPRHFFEDFAYSGTTVPFTAFQFMCGADYPIAEVTSFFETHKSFIAELEIDGINLIGEDGNKLETYEIGEWIKNSPISSFAVKKSFNFNQFDDTAYRPSQLVVPLHYLKSVQYLTLRDYKFTFEQGIRICPKTLLIADVTILKDEKNLTECRINDFIDFKETTEIILSSSKRDYPSTTLILDLEEDFIASEVTLVENTKVKNWRLSRCSIDSLQMYDIPILEKNSMRIKNLKFGNAQMDLAALPKELEKLTFLAFNGAEIPILCSEPMILPKLSYLMLDILYSATLLHFANCSNLVEISIYAFDENVPVFNLNLVPNSVKKLKFPGLVPLEGQIDLETLILDRSSLRNASRILNHIKTNMLGIVLEDDPGESDFNEILIPFLIFIKDITLYIGKIQSASTLNLTEYVDKESDYYVFHDQKGKAITAMEFKVMLSAGEA